MKKLYNRLTALLLLAAGTILPSAADTWEYEFTDNVFADGNTATLNGVEWTLTLQGGTAFDYTSSSDSFFSGQGFTSVKGTSVMMESDFFKNARISKITAYAWDEQEGKMSITDGTLAIKMKTDEGSGAVSDLYAPMYNTKSACYVYTPTSGTYAEFTQSIKITFTKTNGTVRALLKKLVVEYEPAPKPIPFAFQINGVDAISGTATEPGAVLTLTTAGVENPLVVYTVNRDQADDIYNASSGITLADSGNFIYHFTATAPGWLETKVDFSVTVSGGSVDVNSTDFASAAKDFGLTVFSPDSEEYETQHRWWTDREVEYFFEKGERIRLESSEENGTVLSFAPEATLQIGVEQDPEAHIVSVDIEGPNAEAFVIARKGELTGMPRRTEGPKRAAMNWNSGADRVTTVEIRNSSTDTHAGISTVNVEIAHDKRTEVKSVIPVSPLTTPVMYDLSGRRVTSSDPAPGIYILTDGIRIEKIVKQ